VSESQTQTQAERVVVLELERRGSRWVVVRRAWRTSDRLQDFYAYLGDTVFGVDSCKVRKVTKQEDRILRKEGITQYVGRVVVSKGRMWIVVLGS